MNNIVPHSDDIKNALHCLKSLNNKFIYNIQHSTAHIKQGT